MSEIKTLDVEVSFPDILDVDVDFGQTLTKIVAPEHYMGPFEFHVSDEDQVIPVKDKTPAEDIVIKGTTGTEEITENGTYDVLNDKLVLVNVPQKWDINDFLTNTFVFEDGVVTLDTATVIDRNIFSGNLSIKSVYAPYVESVEGGFYSCSNLEDVYFPKLKTTIGQCFRDTKLGDKFHKKFPVIETIGDRTFQNCLFVVIHLPETVKVLSARGLNNCFNLKTVYFHSKPTSIGNVFDAWPSPHITDIYVPWSEGEVSGAPWGATTATVHYDTVYDENWNVISST